MYRTEQTRTQGGEQCCPMESRDKDRVRRRAGGRASLASEQAFEEGPGHTFPLRRHAKQQQHQGSHPCCMAPAFPEYLSAMKVSAGNFQGSPPRRQSQLLILPFPYSISRMPCCSLNVIHSWNQPDCSPKALSPFSLVLRVPSVFKVKSHLVHITLHARRTAFIKHLLMLTYISCSWC